MSSFVSWEIKVLLNLLANSLFNANINIDLSDIDLEKLFSESMSQTVLALAFDALPTTANEYNSEVYNKWQMYSFSVMQKNTSQMYSNAKLEELFSAAELPICTIKGFASAYYYPKKYLRQMGDIDFIVPIEKIDEAKKLLIESDFKCTDDDEKHDFHIGYRKNEEIYEMHKGITSFLDENGYIEKCITDIFTNTLIADFGEIKLTIPDIFAHGLVMLLHMQRHMIDGGGIGLRHLCDWAVFVNSVDNLSWIDLFENKLKEIKLWKFAQALSRVSNIYLGMPEKEWFSNVDTDIAERLLIDIISGGNFGRKDIKRYQELFFLTQRNKSKNKIELYTRGYIRKVYSWNHFFKCNKIFLPIGIVAYFFRTGFLVLFKRKKLNFSQTYESGNSRNNLYDEIFK